MTPPPPPHPMISFIRRPFSPDPYVHLGLRGVFTRSAARGEKCGLVKQVREWEGEGEKEEEVEKRSGEGVEG